MRPVIMATSLRLSASIPLLVAGAIVMTGLSSFGQTPPPPSGAGAASSSSSEQEKSAPESTGPKTYVGSEVCQGCHEDIFKGFQKNKHHVVEIDKGRGWAEKACEACHG